MYEVAKAIVTYLTVREKLFHGMFNSRNVVGDVMQTVYNDGALQIDICKAESYFEIFGLNEAEFRQLKEYYRDLVYRITYWID